MNYIVILKLINYSNHSISMKINLPPLLTVVLLLSIASMATLTYLVNIDYAEAQTNTTQTEANATQDTPQFYANLTNEGIPPLSNSGGSGNATFTLEDGTTMHYVIKANGGPEGSGGVNQIVIGQSTGGRLTDLVTLQYAPTEGLITGGSGTLEGNFTSDNFVGPLAGAHMLDLAKKILDEDVYLVIKTVQFPLGDIGGKIQPVS